MILTDYDNRRCLKIHDHTRTFPTDDQTSLSDANAPVKSEYLSSKPDNSSTTTGDSAESSRTNLNETLFKIRTRGQSKTLSSSLSLLPIL